MATKSADEERFDAQVEALHSALSDLVRVYQFRDRDRVSCHNISVTQCYALESLVEGGPVTLKELAAALYLDKSTASRVVGSLVRKGFAAQIRHPTDGRAVLLVATSSGRRLCARIHREMIEEEKMVLRDLPPQVCDAAPELFRRLTQLAERRSGLDNCASK